MVVSNLETSKDAGWFNSIVNHPSIYPYVCGELYPNSLDLSSLLESPDCFIHRDGDFGGFFFHKVAPGVYEVHTQFLPEGRGPRTVALAKASAEKLFKEVPGSVAITTKVPITNRVARKLAIATGFKFSHREGTWLINGKQVPVDHFILSKINWVLGV